MARLRQAQSRVLPAVHPSIGFEAEIRRKLRKLVDEMHRSVQRAVEAAYKKNEPLIAQDAMPSKVLEKTVRDLASRWRKKFEDAAPKLAKYFSTSIQGRSDTALRSILKDAGIAIQFQQTPAMKDILNAAIAEQVGLIKSIPEKYLGDVQGMVMRSVQTGRDLETLSKDLRKAYGVTRRKASLIARDQNNKATSSMLRARQVELGIKQARWRHSHAGKKPRPTHVKMDNKLYYVSKGMWDSAEKRYVFPGELINCRCTSQSILPGFNDE